MQMTNCMHIEEPIAFFPFCVTSCALFFLFDLKLFDKHRNRRQTSHKFKKNPLSFSCHIFPLTKQTARKTFVRLLCAQNSQTTSKTDNIMRRRKKQDNKTKYIFVLWMIMRFLWTSNETGDEIGNTPSSPISIRSFFEKQCES